MTEAEALAELGAKMDANTVLKSFIGAGYHGTIVPPVVQRNLFENPAWFTAHTPYQAEISQGRLEMLFNFQTLVTELTGLPVASASLLDEVTAVAEAVGIAVRHHRDKRTRSRSPARCTCRPSTWSAPALSRSASSLTAIRPMTTPLLLLVPWPGTHGLYADHGAIIEKAKPPARCVVLVADPLALTLTQSPYPRSAPTSPSARCSASACRWALAARTPPIALSPTSSTRLMPGRLVGQSVDAHGRPGYRLALQTREQHIRRDKATSNICTAQALLANMAAAYAIWHGPEGLQEIAARVHGPGCPPRHRAEGRRQDDRQAIAASTR